MIFCNQDVRSYAKEHGVYLWEVAHAMNIADTTLTKHLRKELDANIKHTIFRHIDRIAEYKSKRKARDEQ